MLINNFKFFINYLFILKKVKLIKFFLGQNTLKKIKYLFKINNKTNKI